jgi:subtilisin family serine protease
VIGKVSTGNWIGHSRRGWIAARGNRQQSPSAPCFGGLIPTYPAAWSTVISVTSTDGDDLKASHAKWGSTVSVAAPGEDIYMTEPPAADSSASSWHIIDDGTSFATPHVAGLAALILSKHGTLSPTNVRDIIEQTADRVHASTDSTSNYFYWEYGPPGNPDSVKCLALGYGRVNARAALEAATTDVAENAFQPLLSSGNTARRLMGSPIPFHLGEGVKLTFAAPGGRRLEVGI